MKKLYFSLAIACLAAGPATAQTARVNTLTTDAAVSAVTTAPAISPDSVFINPDVLPQFTGGTPALQAFLAKNIRYPEQARFLKAKGNAYVRFIVDTQGRISDVTVLRGPGYGLNEEALRLVWFMPPWQPGRQNGQPVRTACTLPISFQ